MGRVSGGADGEGRGGGRGQGGVGGSRERGVEEGGGGAPWRPAKAEEVPAEALVLTLLLAFWGREGGGSGRWGWSEGSGGRLTAGWIPCRRGLCSEDEERRGRRATRTESDEDGEQRKVPALKSGGDGQLQRAAVRVKRRVAVAGRVG